MDSVDELLEKDSFFGSSFLKSDPEHGRILDRDGHSLFAFDRNLTRALIEYLVETYGSTSQEMLQLCGRMLGEQWGEQFEKDIKNYYTIEALDFPVAFIEALLNDALAAYGWGSLRMDLNHRAQGVLVLELVDSPLSDLHPSSTIMPDVLIGGFLTGFFSHYSGTDLDCLITDCPTNDHPSCRYIVTASERIAAIERTQRGPLFHIDVLGQLISASSRIRARTF